jgi:hypothetical protein
VSNQGIARELETPGKKRMTVVLACHLMLFISSQLIPRQPTLGCQFENTTPFLVIRLPLPASQMHA